ncbi:MAG TPA: lanthionine synthetase LanC family protein [Kofleriaceae bacterium]
MSLAWRPLFSGDLAAQMLGIVDDIADATTGPTEHPGNLPAEDAPAWRCSLDALAGQSLLHAYLALHGGTEARADTAIALLDQATDAAGVPAVRPGLYYGFAGTSWVASHLAGRLFEETQDNCLEVDEVLLATLADPMWNARYELLSGVVGMGVYARERLPRPSAVRLIEAVIGRLESCAERNAAGVAFFNPVETLSPEYRDVASRGWYNLGIAHGIAGVISFLGSLCRLGVAVERAAPLLADSVAWLLTRELPAGGDYRFKCTYTPDRDIDICRLGWCHGDLAVATALLVAARGAGEPSWEQHARRIARSAAALAVDSTPVPDASLCHGAAGIGHLFNRLYQETDEPSLGEAARSWLRKAVAMREPGHGFGGYQLYERGKKYNNPGFRVGSSGIALALLAAASPVPPDWDRLLMAS